MLNSIDIRTSQSGYNRDASIEKYHVLRNTFFNNIKHIIKANNYTINEFARKLQEDGLKFDRNYFQPSQTRRGHLNVLIVATFSEIFKVSASQLFDPDLPKYYVATGDNI